MTATTSPDSFTPSQVPISAKVPSGPWSAPATRQRIDPLRQHTGDVMGRRKDSSRLAPIITGVLRFTREPRKTRHTVPSVLPLTIRLVRIEAVADPVPPIFTEEDFAIDFDQEFKRRVEQTRVHRPAGHGPGLSACRSLPLPLMLQPMDRKANGLVKPPPAGGTARTRGGSGVWGPGVWGQTECAP